MLRWLKKQDSDDSDRNEPGPGLPSPCSPLQETLNEVVSREYVSSPTTPGKKRKRGDYSRYSPEMKAKMARYAIMNGNSKAARHFSSVLGKNVNESTIRSFKAAYNIQQKTSGNDRIEAINEKKRGRPTLLQEELENKVIEYIKSLRLSGGVVNTSIVVNIGKGVVLDHDKFMLSENGGTLNITRDWARSLLRRLNFSKRKATKGVKTVASDFEMIKADYLKRINSVVKENDITSDLIINWDQTGLNMVPASQWTMADKGSRQVRILGSDDKRQITALLAATLSGEFLPPQLIYAGKTDKCHPVVDFPPNWHITHTESHWSNESSMLDYVKKIIIPYVEGVRENLPIERCNQTALVIFDVFKAHRSEDLLEILKNANIKVVYVPASCTDELQPMDQIPNKLFKEELKACFSRYYTEQVTKCLGEGRPVTDIDIKTSTIKPIHARWVMQAYDKLKTNRPVIVQAFNNCGITV